MLTEAEVEELVKYQGVQHNEGTDRPRTECPACMVMDKYIAHRSEILALAWGYFKLERTLMTRVIDPPIRIDLKPGGLNMMPGGLNMMPGDPVRHIGHESWFAWPLAIGLVVLGFALGTFLTWFLLSK